MTNKPFWKNKPLNQMTNDEWESICDKCALCCYKRFQLKSGRTLQGQPCSLLDLNSNLCSNYDNRLNIIKECTKLTPENISKIAPRMPETCSYRVLVETGDLPQNHVLHNNEFDEFE